MEQDKTKSQQQVTPEVAAALRPVLSKKTFTPREAARYCGFGITATYKLLATGSMPAIRVGNRYYIPHVALDRWLESEPFIHLKTYLEASYAPGRSAK